jgi:Asp-tRNA(Asn)/Glu-tRNA(Gln) amidotransferase A subunit family amidase
VTAAHYDEARRTTHHGRRAAHDYFAEVDVVISPSAPGEAPATRDTTGDSKFNRLWTLLGTPCLTIPVARGGRNLPVGIQVICRFGADEQVISVAKALEKLLQGAR